ncbi:hypothetical protein GQ600_6133 [Phytophthora cactorum]|nr:hypothetical protein GQ600_6133 [Phytophthora cactorum]
MAAKTNAPFGYPSPWQHSSDLASPSDATIFFSASNVPASISNKKASFFTRAHSLELPDMDEDEDFPMVDLDREPQETPTFSTSAAPTTSGYWNYRMKVKTRVLVN